MKKQKTSGGKPIQWDSWRVGERISPYRVNNMNMVKPSPYQLILIIPIFVRLGQIVTESTSIAEWKKN